MLLVQQPSPLTRNNLKSSFDIDKEFAYPFQPEIHLVSMSRFECKINKYERDNQTPGAFLKDNKILASLDKKWGTLKPDRQSITRHLSTNRHSHSCSCFRTNEKKMLRIATNGQT